METKKMTRDEVIDAIEHCVDDNCKGCPLEEILTTAECLTDICHNALPLLKGEETEPEEASKKAEPTVFEDGNIDPDDEEYVEERKEVRKYAEGLHKYTHDAMENQDISTMTVFVKGKIKDAFIGGVICALNTSKSMKMDMLFQLTKAIYRAIAEGIPEHMANDIFDCMIDAVKEDRENYQINIPDLIMWKLEKMSEQLRKYGKED